MTFETVAFPKPNEFDTFLILYLFLATHFVYNCSHYQASSVTVFFVRRLPGVFNLQLLY